MERMGHSSTRAAVIYQHRTMQRDKIIADAMGRCAKAELRRSDLYHWERDHEIE